MKRLIILLCCLIPLGMMAQNVQSQNRLADQYFQNGEFEKAAAMYKKLYDKQPGNDYFFTRYINALIGYEDFKVAEENLRKKIRKSPENALLFVLFGSLKERQFKDDEAKELYQKAIKVVPPERYKITQLANEFITKAKYDFAVETYEKGGKLLKDKYMFAYNLGDLYQRKGDSPKMIENYLNSLSQNVSRQNTIKTLFQRYLSEEDYTELQTQLYARIQSEPEKTIYAELLMWVFEQSKDYKNAFRQAKALDIKLKERGGRVYKLAQRALNDKDYDAAIEAYGFIVNDLGDESNYYLQANENLLRTKRLKLVKGFSYTKEELLALEKDYETFLDRFGRNKNTATILSDLADLEAYFLNDLDKGIAILEEVIAYPGVQHIQAAKSKISLGDFYLMKGEIWESTLLYSQVDKAFKDDILGQEATFKNAKLAYYSGDFEWAQAQFKILKASTSKLIANDALDLSVFILDNVGLDTTTLPLEKYAAAELLIFQNRFEEAFASLDSIKALFPNHELEDDVFYAKASVYTKKREYEAAARMYEKIMVHHADGIRADDSIYKLAMMYEHPDQLNKPEEALKLYEKIITDYSGSTYAVDSRKRFRALRGDLEQ